MSFVYGEEEQFMKALPRLSDLYVVGRDFEIVADTPDGKFEIPVYIQKLNPNEHDECMVAANAKRAVILSLKKMHDLEEKPREYMNIQNDLADISFERTTLVDYMSLTAVLKYKMRRQAEVAATDEWSEDNYYRGLVDAWNGGLEERLAANENDPEAKRVSAELDRFNDQVEELVAAERTRIVASYFSKSTDELIREATDRVIDDHSDAAWVNEFRANQIYYCTREAANHDERYFQSMKEVRSCDPRITLQLTDFIDSLDVDNLEGKESQESTSS